MSLGSANLKTAVREHDFREKRLLFRRRVLKIMHNTFTELKTDLEIEGL